MDEFLVVAGSLIVKEVAGEYFVFCEDAKCCCVIPCSTREGRKPASELNEHGTLAIRISTKTGDVIAVMGKFKF